jgi:hypothetical protein
VASVKDAEPQISLVQNSVERNDTPARWRIGWSVQNLGADPIRILAVRLPHGQFKSEELGFDPPVDLAPGEGRRFSTLVRCDEPPGLVTENAFVIFQANWRGVPWRIFVRLRIVVNGKGGPNATTELITTQEVGFTGVKF